MKRRWKLLSFNFAEVSSQSKSNHPHCSGNNNPEALLRIPTVYISKTSHRLTKGKNVSSVGALHLIYYFTCCRAEVY